MARSDLVVDTYCRDCKRPAEVVLDHIEGDTICSECGLVLSSLSNDEASEWSTFADKYSGQDPTPVGEPISPLLSEVSLPTTTPVSESRVALGPGAGRVLVPGKLRRRGGSFKASKSIAAMVDRLGLVTIIKDRANEIYKKVEDQKQLKGRNQEAVAAACLYIACRQENKPHTVKEICSVVDTATKKEIGRAKELVLRQLEVETGQSVEMGTIHATDYLRRFCLKAGMTNQAVKAAHEVIQKSGEIDIRRSPISVAAAVIFIISQLSDDKKTLKDISVATQVAEITIKNSFKDLHPHLKKIVPTWFANEEEVTSLQLWTFLERNQLLHPSFVASMNGGKLSFHRTGKYLGTGYFTSLEDIHTVGHHLVVT